MIALVSWPVHSLRPLGGADWNWVAALSYAAEHGLNFGEQIVWSYGPLGFLNTWYGPVLYYDDVLLASWLFALFIQVLLAGALLVVLRRSLPLVAAVIAAAVVLAPTRDLIPALALVWCGLMLTREDDDAPSDRAADAIPLALGALTGVALLGKLNQGIELVVLVGIALAALRRRRDALAFAGALLATAAVGWLGSGQSLADAWPYLRNGAEVVAGYAAAMGTTDPPHRWTYAAAAGIVALALAFAWDATRAMPSRRRWGLLGLLVVYAGFTFKEGFVRQDRPHLEVFFGDMLVLFAILPMRPFRQPLLLAGVVAGLVALSGVSDVARTLNPYANLTAAADQVRTLASPSRREAIVADVRAGVDVGYAVPPAFVDEIGHRSVMMWPYLYGEVAYAYDFNLRPLPSFEPYAAYTPALDRLGGEMLASSRAPERILRGSVPAIDGRFPTFEAPLATLGILCRYREIGAQGPWELLARSQNRCGSERTLSTATAGWGDPVPIPQANRPDALVLVRIEGAGPAGLERLTGLLLRPSPRWIALDEARFRLVAATAADGLLLRAPLNADFPGTFTMAPNPGYVAVGREGSEPGGDLRYTFVEVPIRPFPADGGAR